MRIEFETTDCGRCEGSGNYAGYGVCWGCSGARRFLTAKGKRARQAYETEIMDYVGVTADALIPGNVVRSKAWNFNSLSGSDFAAKSRKIESTETGSDGRIVITFQGGTQYGYRPDELVRLVDKGFTPIVQDIMESIAARYAGASLVS